MHCVSKIRKEISTTINCCLSQNGHARDNSEHALIDAEKNGWDASAANRGLVEDILETEVFLGHERMSI